MESLAKELVVNQSSFTEDVSRLLVVIEEFRNLDAEMQTQSVAIFLKIASHHAPIKMADIANSLGLAQSSVSRNVAYLGDWNRHKQDGHKLVEAYEDPSERRRKLVKLTKKGEKFASKISQLLECN